MILYVDESHAERNKLRCPIVWQVNTIIHPAIQLAWMWKITRPWPRYTYEPRLLERDEHEVE